MFVLTLSNPFCLDCLKTRLHKGSPLSFLRAYSLDSFHSGALFTQHQHQFSVCQLLLFPPTYQSKILANIRPHTITRQQSSDQFSNLLDTTTISDDYGPPIQDDQNRIMHSDGRSSSFRHGYTCSRNLASPIILIGLRVRQVFMDV